MWAFALALCVACRPGPVSAQTGSPEWAERTAKALLQPGQAGAVLAKASPLDAFVRRQSGPLQADATGEYHLRFDRSYQGIPVHGGDIIVHLRRDGTVSDVTGAPDKPLSLPTTTPGVERRVALAQALTEFRAQGQVESSHAELVVETWAQIPGAPLLAWRVEINGTRCDHPSQMRYIFDAASGLWLYQFDAQVSAVPFECRVAEPH
jgi:zinc metalloprotease ZmpA